MKHFRLFLIGFLILAPSGSWAAWPGECPKVVYRVVSGPTTLTPQSNGVSVNIDISVQITNTGNISVQSGYVGTPVTVFTYQIGTFYFENNAWHQQALAYATMSSAPPGELMDPMSIQALNAKYPNGCGPPPNPCQELQGKYAGMYCFANVEIGDRCFNGCLASPDRDGPGAVEMWSPSGGCWSVRMEYTGAQCGGDGPGPPGPPDEPPPPPPDNCDPLRAACAAKCSGRVSSVNCETGACSCNPDNGPFVPGPPPEPETPNPGPTNPDGTPNPTPPPTNNTATSDPGSSSDASPQLGAVIANQNTQIAQGNAISDQINHLGQQLGSVNDNMGKLVQQGNNMQGALDRIANATEDMRNNQRNEAYDGGLPSSGDYKYSGDLPEGTDWNENSDGSEVGKGAAQKLQQAPSTGPDVFQGSITAGGNPCVSGNLMGSEINICFNYPWMQTGYSIMRVALIALAYIQTALLLRRGWGGTN